MSVSFFGMRLWVFFQKRLVSETPSTKEPDTLKLPVMEMVYDLTVLVGGVLRPVHEVETLKLPAVAKANAASGEVAVPARKAVEAFQRPDPITDRPVLRADWAESVIDQPKPIADLLDLVADLSEVASGESQFAAIEKL
jgi:hypothetical protein